MDYKKDWEEKFREAQIFQDYAAIRLYKKGIMAFPFTSALYQQKVGECVSGIEYKYDRLFRETGNLFIEFEARFTPEQEFRESGLLRNDNTWLYVIGDFYTLYLLSKRQLLNEVKFLEEVTNNMGTARGYLLPVSLVENALAIEVIYTKPTEAEKEFLIKAGILKKEVLT